MRRLAWMLLVIGLVCVANAARAPKEAQDLMNGLDSLWGKSTKDFAKDAGLKSGDYQVAGSDKKIVTINEPSHIRWTPKSLAGAMQSAEFDSKLGLVAVVGVLKGTADDFAALLKELNARYGQYSMHSGTDETQTYGWVFPKATLSVSSKEGAPQAFRIEANP